MAEGVQRLLFSPLTFGDCFGIHCDIPWSGGGSCVSNLLVEMFLVLLPLVRDLMTIVRRNVMII